MFFILDNSKISQCIINQKAIERIVKKDNIINPKKEESIKKKSINKKNG